MASRGLVEDVVSLDSAPLVLKPGGRTYLVTGIHSRFEFQIGHLNLIEGDLISERYLHFASILKKKLIFVIWPIF